MQWHSCKIRARNCALSQEVKSCQFLVIEHSFLEEYCKNFARFSQLARILQGIARYKFSVCTLRSDNLCISPKSEHNQPLDVKFDDNYSC